jgi:GDP-mannose 6-dehydrogenase
MKVSVFGLGYVGSVSAAMLASDGHDVIGVDLNPDKVAAINAGASPIVEPGLGEALQDVVSKGRLRATTNTEQAVRESEISLICVGTPSRKNGSLDLSYVERVAKEIGSVLKDKPDYHVVVVRSTVLPGSTHSIVIPALESESGGHGH